MPALSNPRHEQVAALVAAGLPVKRAMISAGYSGLTATTTGSRLVRKRTVANRINELRTIATDAMMKYDVARKEDRIRAKNEIWNGLRQVIAERAKDPAVQKAPGGRTGLVVREMRMIGAGESAMPVEEFRVDTGLLAEIRKTEEHVAHELGQWSEGGTNVNVHVAIGAGIGAPAVPTTIDATPVPVAVLDEGETR